MRPVNLIPPEERRGERAATRTGPVAYILVGVLVLAVGAVALLVSTNNRIADQRSQIATLKAEQAVAQEKVNRLGSFADFATLKSNRQQTVSSLAQSRFDWERVMRELALVIPKNVWLTKVSATVSPDVTVDNGADVSLRGAVAGPALELVGCGASQQAVAHFAAALKEIDGVTRVGVGKSERSDQSSGTAAAPAPATGASGTSGDCRVRGFIPQFEMVAAFDAVQVDPVSGLPVAPAGSATPASSSPSDSQVTDGQAQEAQARQDVQNGIERARQTAADVVPGVVK